MSRYNKLLTFFSKKKLSTGEEDALNRLIQKFQDAELLAGPTAQTSCSILEQEKIELPSDSSFPPPLPQGVATANKAVTTAKNQPEPLPPLPAVPTKKSKNRREKKVPGPRHMTISSNSANDLREILKKNFNTSNIQISRYADNESMLTTVHFERQENFSAEEIRILEELLVPLRGQIKKFAGELDFVNPLTKESLANQLTFVIILPLDLPTPGASSSKSRRVSASGADTT
ncbi:MAG: hypothetical protein A2504_10085 [Bdellovibrionales bacterium RIFOXYD12_FULL_39_22]|nr:MAG: hypothetical protein A2385_17720 [Bdellovibrionales bacterium RIFOXYB1_FULL_39_21]OFZ43958.1 MAG: hypothetical protein A2485_04390 [Bdellovibrionales bacterium RIFOXYC12_FULL_39_17]OFZ48330.1 MAG: hypothetical protein A2404_01805 [Bdellovibrionales bacterium RIFOXYC1_FULL_39_130]OFZ76635.1 MAG: hypothetical protein A2560_17400 [Bdellovibrionales bacterium RIFOXYD1_FULL_39_84]OFZ94921.1 MAG: hypothetical protein A2504_10085 [Bdellovibrionales bacterium RIFOXYD12_FULL_39_22]HLE12657.1 hy